MIAYAVVAAIHLLSVALLIGFMAIVQITVVPAQNLLDGRSYALFEGRMNVTLQRLTPVLMITAAVSGIVLTVLAAYEGHAVVWLHGLATLGIVAMIVSTLRINAPVNDAIITWNPDALPGDGRAQRDRWERGHALRVAIGVPVLLLAVVAAVI